MGYREEFEKWISDDYFDEATKQELLAIRNDEKEVEKYGNILNKLLGTKKQ